MSLKTNSATNFGGAEVQSQDARSMAPEGFELDVTLLEVTDSASLVNLTNDGCGSTCGACTTGVV
ncbi:FxLD family lanthipeptide [Streptomyces evansiae]|uniref:FxLD family lanthipeptide n=1 Tax=Streptomyces evansiae TaxID=3075535 RepID=UPI0028881AF8|nr:FxLD family lanthipeptide [Streptomyces sp. DSM 41859]MDT0422974.1 FxLD family lanthipeptide [Streptomyces sp. DSM 41859]